MKKFLLIAATALLSANAFAGSGTMFADANAVNSSVTYSADGAGYSISALSGKAVTTITGNGIFAAVNQTQEIDLATRLPDKSKGEFSVASVERTGNSTAILHVQALHVQALENSDAGPLTVTADEEVALVQGTFADVDAGKSVQIKLTAKGIAADRAMQKDVGNRMAKQLAATLQAQGVKVRNSTVNVNTSVNDIGTLSKEQLVMPQAFMKIHVEISAATN